MMLSIQSDIRGMEEQLFGDLIGLPDQIRELEEDKRSESLEKLREIEEERRQIKAEIQSIDTEIEKITLTNKATA